MDAGRLESCRARHHLLSGVSAATLLMSAKRYSCNRQQTGHVIFPLYSAASLTNIEKTLPQFLQGSSTLSSLIFASSGDGLLNRAGNGGKRVVGVRANESNSANH